MKCDCICNHLKFGNFHDTAFRWTQLCMTMCFNAKEMSMIANDLTHIWKSTHQTNRLCIYLCGWASVNAFRCIFTIHLNLALYSSSTPWNRMQCTCRIDNSSEKRDNLHWFDTHPHCTIVVCEEALHFRNSFFVILSLQQF